MVFMVSLCCFSGSKLGATTAKPTRTPSWIARAIRSGSAVSRGSCTVVRGIAKRTKDAVGYEADVKEGNDEPGTP